LSNSYEREVIMTESVHLSMAGTGAEYAAPDATVTVKVGGEHTAAQYEIFEIDAPRGPAAPPHSESWSKAFYVLQGRILVQAGDQGYDLGPGSSISIPAGTLNTFSVLTPSAKFLTVSQTSRMGAFFAELATADPTDYAALGEISSRHGVTLASGATA
jgi:quercetin dioxygenase-like cupin family protein